MSDFIHTLKNVGVRSDQDFSRQRKIQMSNVLFSLTGFYTLLISVIFLLVGRDFPTILISVFISFTFSLCIFFNKQGWFTSSRQLFFSTIVVGIWSSAFVNGENFMLEIAFLPAIGIPFLLYLKSEIKQAFFWGAVFMISYFVMSFWYEQVSPINPISVEEAETLNKILVVLLFIWSINIVLLFSVEQRGNDFLVRKSKKDQGELMEIVELKNKKISDLEDLLVRKEREILDEKNHNESNYFKNKNCEIFKSMLSLDLSEILKFQSRNPTDEELSCLIKNLTVLHGKADASEFKTVRFNTNINKRVNFLIDGLKWNKTPVYFDNEIQDLQYVKTDGFQLSYLLEGLLTEILFDPKKGELFLQLKKSKEDKMILELIATGDFSFEFLFEKKSLIELQEFTSAKLWLDGNQKIVIDFDLLVNDYNEEKPFKGTSRRIKVLLVDDVDINLQLSTVLLQSLGCVVTQATSGEEVVEIYENGKFDLILMDINLPGLNGDEVMLKLKEEQEADTMWIALTANAIVGDKEKYLEKGFNDYLTKPITIQKLTQCLGNWFPEAKSTIFKAEANFLLDLSQIEQTAKLLGGWPVYFTFIDRFLVENTTICGEMTEALKHGNFKNLALLLHKLGGIASSVGAIGYFEILHSRYIAIKEGRGVSAEELNTILQLGEETNIKLNNLKTIKS